ncbi:hypothetical protein NLJ89_g5366 [Agrocybe chaxingu]|uniref:Uncharacterized protein n=1 Tax=Agrocybe chaxingu TaxID=84603 RepID=A0A9W8MTN4_9AGAR|nr:hypothetical protein NLJ89_g5366 [Agrocybe chaxingu]
MLRIVTAILHCAHQYQSRRSMSNAFIFYEDVDNRPDTPVFWPKDPVVERRPQADPLPSKVGEIGFQEGVHAVQDRSQEVPDVVLPARHPADRDTPSPANDAAPSVDSETPVQPSTPSQDAASPPESIAKSSSLLGFLKPDRTIGGLHLTTILIFLLQLSLFSGTIVARLRPRRFLSSLSSDKSYFWNAVYSACEENATVISTQANYYRDTGLVQFLTQALPSRLGIDLHFRHTPRHSLKVVQGLGMWKTTSSPPRRRQHMATREGAPSSYRVSYETAYALNELNQQPAKPVVNNGLNTRLVSYVLFQHPSSSKKIGRTTVVLNEQEAGISVPTFGRSAHISGTVCFEESSSVLGVVLQVEGKLDSTISEAGGHSTKLFSQRYPLWSQCNSQGEPCPSQIPFSVFLPSTFTYNGAAAPLPPSFHSHFMDVPALFVKASYQLRFIITRIRHKKLEMWPKVKHISVPFTYVPRTRSHRPIVRSPCFFSSVKTSPEEWYQAVTSLRTRPNAKIDPITCHLFIPAGRIYGLRDKIPFHVQLSGIICTLKDVFAGCVSGLDRVLSVDSSNTTASRRSPAANPLIRVYLLRQVSVSMKGTSAWRNMILGEGTLAPIPPDLSSCCSLTRQCREGHVDWEGEVSCRDDITVGSFSAANVHVKDFIALSLTPPDRRSSPLLDLQLTIPIRLVTDSWADITGPEPDNAALAQ